MSDKLRKLGKEILPPVNPNKKQENPFIRKEKCDLKNIGTITISDSVDNFDTVQKDKKVTKASKSVKKSKKRTSKRVSVYSRLGVPNKSDSEEEKPKKKRPFWKKKRTAEEIAERKQQKLQLSNPSNYLASTIPPPSWLNSQNVNQYVDLL